MTRTYGRTVRIEGARVVVSDDDGRTWIASPEEAAQITTAVEDVCAGTEQMNATPATLIATAAEASRPPRRASHLVRTAEVLDGWLAAPLDTIPRERATPPGLDLSHTLREVLAKRRSRRAFGSLDVLALRELLTRVAMPHRVGVGDDGYRAELRSVPSPGATHPCQLVVLTRDVVGLDDGEYLFDTESGQLLRVSLRDELCLRLLEGICAAGRVSEPAPATVLCVAQVDRLLRRYRSGTSLLWRDAGALLALLHLVATDLGLASCIVGIGGVAWLDEPHGSAVDVGALMVGAALPELASTSS